MNSASERRSFIIAVSMSHAESIYRGVFTSFPKAESWLKDNNHKGKEIYEGDIVYLAGSGNCIVSITPSLGVTFTEIDDKFGVWGCHEELMESNVESIIGNIYQNTELLK